VANDVDCGRRAGRPATGSDQRTDKTTRAGVGCLGRTVRVELAGDALPAPHQLAVRPARERAVVRLGRPAVGLGLGGDDPVPDELMDVLAPANELRVLERR
jgi:hypothetical protein